MFLFHDVLDRIGKVAPPACKEALDASLSSHDAVVGLSLSNFGPEFSTPKDGRVWKWKVDMDIDIDKRGVGRGLCDRDEGFSGKGAPPIH